MPDKDQVLGKDPVPDKDQVRGKDPALDKDRVSDNNRVIPGQVMQVPLVVTTVARILTGTVSAVSRVVPADQLPEVQWAGQAALELVEVVVDVAVNLK